MQKWINKFAGTCECGTRVEVGAGYRVKPNGEFVTRCRPCVDGTEPVVADPTPPIEKRPSFPPTAEQTAALDLFREGKTLAIQALAGTGKTSTLVLMGNSTTQEGRFLAFNKKIVADSKTKFSKNVKCSTVHSVAFAQVGKKFKSRLNAKRMSSAEIARRLDIEPFYCQVGEERKVLQPSKLAGLVMSAIAKFCHSADLEPDASRHLRYVPAIDLPSVDVEGSQHRTYANNDKLRVFLQPYMEAAWYDLSRTDGTLRFDQAVYVKLWSLGTYGEPVIPGDFIMVDEAQDLSWVMIAALEKQVGKQIVLVGDRNQIIYTWRGSVDAMSEMATEATTYLTNSFRFGPEIAGAANAILAKLDCEVEVVGRGKPGVVRKPGSESSTKIDAVLTRTNAGAIDVLLEATERGEKVAVVGGSEEVENFAKAAQALQHGEPTEHIELSIFENWNQVLTYVEEDELGEELAPMVRLIEKYGVETVLQAAGSNVAEDEADLVVSTAHKSKGCEWNSVKLHGDFPAGERQDEEELRTLYVAVTRAKSYLDVTACQAGLDLIFPGAEVEDDEDEEEGR